MISSASVYAQSIPLQNLDVDDFSRLVGDFSANSVHTSVSGASSLGHVFGMEFGLVGGMTNTPQINKLVQEADPGSKVARLPHGEILGAVSVPAGVTIEAGLIPKVGSSDFKFNQLSLAAKWTFTDLFFELPFAMAVKAQVTKSHLAFKATPGGVDTSFDYSNTLTGLQFLISKDLGLLEPYFGIGMLSAKGKMSVDGSTTVFSDSALKAAGSADATRSSSAWMLGTEVKLVVVKLGVEYAYLFHTSSMTGKLSFYF